VTPCQVQNSIDALLHEAKTLVGADSCDLKQRRACRSSSLSTHMANCRQQKKVRRQGNQTEHGRKKHEVAIVISLLGDQFWLVQIVLTQSRGEHVDHLRSQHIWLIVGSRRW
jgi:hypothetical protein